MRRFATFVLILVIVAGSSCGGSSDVTCQPHCTDAYHLETCSTFTDIHGNRTSVLNCGELQQNGINLVCRSSTASCEQPL